MEKRWKIKEADEEKWLSLAGALQIKPLISRILVARGIESFSAAKKYFRPDITSYMIPG